MSGYLSDAGVDVGKTRTAWGELQQLNSKYGELATDASLAAGGALPPPFGTAADVASLGRSIWKGDWGGALMDVAGFVPLFGDGAKAAKIANKLVDIRRAIDVAATGMTRAFAKTKEAAAKYWDDIVKINRAKYDEAIKACGNNKKCIDKKAGLKGEHYKQTPREFDDAGNRRGQWLDENGNPAERGDGIWHPVNGSTPPVKYENGFPNFSDVSAGNVEIPMRGNRTTTKGTGDFYNAEQAYIEKYGEMPDGYYENDFTWHHKEDGITMELVPREIHSANGHAGGATMYEGTNADAF